MESNDLLQTENELLATFDQNSRITKKSRPPEMSDCSLAQLARLAERATKHANRQSKLEAAESFQKGEETEYTKSNNKAKNIAKDNNDNGDDKDWQEQRRARVMESVERAVRNERLVNYFGRRKSLVVVGIPGCPSMQLLLIAHPNQDAKFEYHWSAEVYRDCQELRILLEWKAEDHITKDYEFLMKDDGDDDDVDPYFKHLRSDFLEAYRKPKRYFSSNPVPLAVLLNALRDANEFGDWESFFDGTAFKAPCSSTGGSSDNSDGDNVKRDDSHKLPIWTPPPPRGTLLEIDIDGTVDNIEFPCRSDEEDEVKILRDASASNKLWLDTVSKQFIKFDTKMGFNPTNIVCLRVTLDDSRFFDFLFYHLHLRLT